MAKPSAPPRPVRVLLVDDHPLVRDGVRSTLQSDDFSIVGECAEGETVMDACVRHQPDVVLLDLSLPGIGGFDVARLLRSRQPRARVVIFTVHEDMGLVREARRCGAAGFLPKSASPARLRRCLRHAAEGRTVFPRTLGKRGLTAALTPREREVLGYIAAGSHSRAIAARMGLSIRTVEKHRENLMRKLKLKGSAALTKHAVRHGLDAGRP